MRTLRANNSDIDWMSRDSHFFFNTRHPQSKKWQELARALPFFPGHIYLFTSSHKKIAILSKKSFLISARAVNQHLKCHRKDRWLISLPLTHTGGLSILARSFCGSFSSVKGPDAWNPKTFLDTLKSEKITLCSLVPAQVYDLVQKCLSPPKCLKAVVVGGGALSPSLYIEARKLNWPVLPSYGLTELCSQVATAPLSSLYPSGLSFESLARGSLSFCSVFRGKTELPQKRESPQNHHQTSSQADIKEDFFPELKILPHIQLKEEKGTLHIQSKALLKGYFDLEKKEFLDPKTSEGWFDTGDLGEIRGGNLRIKGRKENQIKILGELTDLTDLSHRLESLVSELSLIERFVLLPVSDPRKEWDLQIVTTSFNDPDILRIVEKFNKKVAPFQKVKKVYSLEKLPKTDIFKVSLEQIKKQIGLKNRH